MPRRLPVRPAKIVGNLFVLFVLIVICTIYYTYVAVVFGPKLLENPLYMIQLGFFNLLVLMLLWSFVQAMTTDPGQVPVFWGFHLGDAENKRRRYCLMCNVFKPERCHHCSACNRCVLNMDHHCPWINNCIGFWNRKYFLLLLFYVLFTTYYVVATMFYEFLLTVKWEVDAFYYTTTPHDRELLIRALMIQVAYVLTCIVAVLITFFLKFHIMLAQTNKTTIENLDKKGKPYKSPYDLGGVNNIYQIMGTNKLLWPFPVFCGSGKPLGDGIYWSSKSSSNEAASHPNQDIQSQYSSNNPAPPIARSQDQSYAARQQSAQQYPSGYDATNASAQASYMGRINPAHIITAYPQAAPAQAQIPRQYQMAGIQPQQEIGQPQNRIIMHGQDKNQVQNNLRSTIFSNNQRAQQLVAGVGQQQFSIPSNGRVSRDEQAKNNLAMAGNSSQQPTSGKMLPKNRRDGQQQQRAATSLPGQQAPSTAGTAQQRRAGTAARK